MSDAMSDAKFHLVARASILASGDSDDFHHVAPDEVVLVAVEALAAVRRERDEAQSLLARVMGPDVDTLASTALLLEKAERERDEWKSSLNDALEQLRQEEHRSSTAERERDEQLDDSERIIAALAKERDDARADAALFRIALENCTAIEVERDLLRAESSRLREALVESREAQHKASLERDWLLAEVLDSWRRP